MVDRDALVTEHFEWARRLLRFHRRTWLPDDAEGIAMEALLEAARSWEPGGMSFRGYARQIIDYRIEDARRTQGMATRDGTESRGTRTGRLSTDLYRTLSRPAAQGDIVDARRALERMAALKPRLQRVLALRAQGWSLIEIGRELGVTESRACQMLKEALRRL